jgi:hypothetical protein
MLQVVAGLLPGGPLHVGRTALHVQVETKSFLQLVSVIEVLADLFDSHCRLVSVFALSL